MLIPLPEVFDVLQTTSFPIALALDVGSVSVDDEEWVLRFHMVHTSESGNNAKNTVSNIGLSSITGGITSTQDFVGLNLQSGQDDSEGGGCLIATAAYGLVPYLETVEKEMVSPIKNTEFEFVREVWIMCQCYTKNHHIWFN